MIAESSQREPIEELAEEFLERLRRGEHPALTEYTQRYPDLAAKIRDLFPTLVIMERLGKPDDSLAGGEAIDDMTKGPRERWLGEYRLLREIGRGGMGVVYEAEQASLGRHVALKVLASHWRMDARQLKRFHREARAVARLQHPHIVPVYDMGEHGGIPYYAMQYIRGQGLDAVLAELQRLRNDSPSIPEYRSIYSDDQKGNGPSPGCGTGSDPSDEVKASSVTLEKAFASTTSMPGARSNSGGATSVVQTLGGQSNGVGVSSSDVYFLSVARIGVQVAEALAYAHEQGILHRDIKPSNLILDDTGTIWVTDFGLAKATCEDNLTDSGDFVGTLRYMAPEQLRGWADPRSDVYSLGLTLYELIALQPAFKSTDRAELMAQVLQEQLPRLRKVCGRVPSDLETIVQKATAKEAQQRYGTASELASDLRRFLDGKPILARPTALTKRAWLWSRRNPVVASLLLCLLVTLPTALGLVTYLWWVAEGERREVVAKHKQNRELLGEAYLAEARALLATRRPEHRREALAVIGRAASILPSKEARNVAITALTSPSLERVQSWQPPASVYHAPCLDSEFTRHATVEGRTLKIRSIADNSLLEHHDLPEECLPLGSKGVAHAFFRQTPELLLWVQHPLGVSLVQWDYRHQRVVWRSQNFPLPVFTISPNQRYVAFVARPNYINVVDLVNQELTAGVVTDAPPTKLTFSPDCNLLAAATPKPEIIVCDWKSGLATASAPAPEVMDLCWSPDGSLIASGGTNFRTSIWKYAPKRGLSLEAVLTGHRAEVTGVRYSPDGNLLGTTSWDGTTILWDALGLIQQSQVPGNLIGFDSSGKMFATKTNLDATYHIWSVAQPTGLYRLKGHAAGGKGPKEVDINPDGQLLASASHDGVRLWDLNSKQHLAHLSTAFSWSVRFHPDGTRLIACGMEGVQLFALPYAVRREAAADQLLTWPSELSRLSLDSTGNTLAIVDWNQQAVLVFPSCQLEAPLILRGHTAVREVAVSPDGRWLATATWHGKGVRIWNAQTGTYVQEILPESGTALLAFSPDGRWLMVGTGAEYQMFSLDGWLPVRSFTRTQGGNIPGAAAFSADRRVIAVCPTTDSIRLIDVDTGTELATLAAPEGDILTWLRFSPDGKRLVAGTENNVIQVWDLAELNSALEPFKLNWQ